VKYFHFCCDWWAVGGAVNYFLLFATFFIFFCILNPKFSKAFVNILIGTLPCMGMLGTVIGMIECFNSMALTGADVKTISNAISKALITTLVGLGVAIFGSLAVMPKPKKDGQIQA
tara:strand:+ start:551 stop:898 length:348 start_codon:yes stop_codon:yes gene_type:complete